MPTAMRCSGTGNNFGREEIMAIKKPNIVMIMADDVGTWNVSAYHRGMMGGRTPNIDRIA